MRLVITGLEYSGKSSLGGAVVEWIGETMGQETGLHDHYWPTISHQELTDEEQKYLLGLTPRLKELVMRNNLDYHAQRSFYKSGDPDHLVSRLRSSLHYSALLCERMKMDSRFRGNDERRLTASLF